MTDKTSHVEVVSLKLIGLDDKERVKFESILAIAEHRLKVPWQITEEGKIDFYLISHRLRSQMDQNLMLSALSRHKCIFSTTAETDSIENELLMTGDGLPSFRSLILLFNTLADNASAQQTPPDEKEPTPSSSDSLASSGVFKYQKKVDSIANVSGEQSTSVTIKSAPQPKDSLASSEIFKPQEKTKPIAHVSRKQKESIARKPAPKAKDSLASSEVFTYQQKPKVTANKVKPASPSLSEKAYFDLEAGFVGLLRSGKTAIYRFNLEIEGKSATLYINLFENKYYSNFKLEALQPFFADNAVSLSQELTEIVFQSEISAQGLKQNPLTHIIWYAVFSLSQGRARKGYQDSDIAYLKRWPDINLPGCRDLIKLAAFMQSNAVELSVAQKKTGFSIQQIYNFYNACYAIGLVVHTDQQDIHDKKINTEKRILFSQIGERLKQIKNL